MSGATEKMLVDNLISDLQTRPEDFRFSEHILLDEKSNASYWISKGQRTGLWQPYEIGFSIRNHFRFRRALKKLATYKVLNYERVEA